MSSDTWEKKKLIEVTTKIGSGSTPRGGSKSYKEFGIPFIRSQNIYNCEFNPSGLVYIDEEQAKKLSNVELKKDDILLNITGDSVARCTNVPNRFIGGRVNQHVSIIRADNEQLIPSFLKYYLVSSDMQELMLSWAQSGGTRAALTKGMIETFEIPLPGIEEQKSIVNVLSTLDEKIEKNKQINSKLEEIAQTIFRQWFVDFEFPNEEGKPYKSSGGQMVESELGLIPKGWEVTTFRSFTSNVLGGDWGKENEQGNYKKAIYCLRGADIPEVSEGRKGSLPKRYILEKNHKNKKLTSGDLVIEISGGSPTQSTGRITYINDLMLSKYDEDFLCTNFCRAVTLEDPLYMYYFYFYWKMLYELDVFFQFENGTTGIKNLDINSFLDRFKIISPGLEKVRKFDALISPIIDLIQMNGNENLNLSRTRDTLIPKIMSGEIRVPFEN